MGSGSVGGGSEVLVKNKSTKENREFWTHVESVANSFEPGQIVELDYRRKPMTLTGKVTSVHTGSRFTDGNRRVVVSISDDKGNSYNPFADITLQSDILQLDENVAIVITPVPRNEPVYFRPRGTEATPPSSSDIRF